LVDVPVQPFEPISTLAPEMPNTQTGHSIIAQAQIGFYPHNLCAIGINHNAEAGEAANDAQLN
jgi:hypothetical protein